MSIQTVKAIDGIKFCVWSPNEIRKYSVSEITAPETDEDFECTIQLIKDIAFDQSFSFIYSPRPGTPASNLVDQTKMSVKKERLQLLQSHIRDQAMEISRNMVGSEQQILVEKLSKKSQYQVTGRTENMRWVNFDADSSYIGQFVNIIVTEALPNSLRGRMI